MLESFTDELLRLRGGREALVKTAMTMAEARVFVRRTENNEFEHLNNNRAHLEKGYKAHEIVTGLRVPDPPKKARLSKTARKIPPTRLLERMTAVGAAGGAGSHGLQHGKAMMTGNPWDAPTGTTLGAATKTGLGGAAIATLFSLLGRMARRGRR